MRVAAVLVVLVVAAQLRPYDIAFDDNTKAWLADAAAHQPGQADAAFERIREWNADRLLNALEEIRRNKWKDELNPHLEHAALLHADISLLTRHTRRPPPLAGWSSAVTVKIVQDGRVVGSRSLDPHVEFGRRVLATLRPDGAQAQSARVRQWYRAVAADFALRHWLADLGPHLEAARDALPRDAGIRFDSGCLAEVLASAQIQTAAPERPPLSVMGGLPPEGLPRVTYSVSVNLGDAEKYYRAAVAFDPSMLEARVRLARVLSLRGRHREAIGVLEERGDSTDPIVQYYGALTLGDTLERGGRLEDARDAYAQASLLYPNAQTPWIAIARLSRELADRTATNQALTKLAALPTDERKRQDPWWDYFDCNGRNAQRETAALWNMFKGDAR